MQGRFPEDLKKKTKKTATNLNDLGLGSFGYSMPQFPQLQSGENVLLPHMAVVRTKYNTVPTSLLGKTGSTQMKSGLNTLIVPRADPR